MFTCLFNTQMHLFLLFFYFLQTIYSDHIFLLISFSPVLPHHPTQPSLKVAVITYLEPEKYLEHYIIEERVLGLWEGRGEWSPGRDGGGPFNLHVHSGLGFSHRFHESLSLLLLFGMMGNSRVYNGYTTKWMPATSLKHILEEGSDGKFWHLKF